MFFVLLALNFWIKIVVNGIMFVFRFVLSQIHDKHTHFEYDITAQEDAIYISIFPIYCMAMTFITNDDLNIQRVCGQFFVYKKTLEFSLHCVSLM